MKKKLIKKLSLNKQTVADLRAGEKSDIKGGAGLTNKSCVAQICPPATGITCEVPTGCVVAPPTECHSPTYSVQPWVCPC